MAFEVEVLDLGINNLASLRRGLLEAADIELRVIADGSQSQGADLLVLPGVGAYGAAMEELASRNLGAVVTDHVAAGRPLFGVCLGMQLLGESSEESPGEAGLGVIPGTVRKLPSNPATRVPNMGWSGLSGSASAEQFPTLTKGLDFYFVHSYAMVPSDDGDVLVTSPFGDEQFVSGILHDNVLGLQFHPEKSSRGGIHLLGDVIAWAHG